MFCFSFFLYLHTSPQIHSYNSKYHSKWSDLWALPALGTGHRLGIQNAPAGGPSQITDHCPSPNACRRCSWPRSRRTARKMRGRAAASASRSSTRRSCRKSPRRGRVDPQDCHAQPRPAREEARPLTLARAAESRVSLRACLLYTSPSPRDGLLSRMPSSA